MPIATPEAGKDRLKAFKNKGKDQDVSIGPRFIFQFNIQRTKKYIRQMTMKCFILHEFLDDLRFHELF